MSIFDAPVSGTSDSGPAPDAGVAAPVSPAPDAGAPGDALGLPEGTPEAPAAPEPTYFDSEQFSNHLVKLKVGGEDVELPLSEALKGAMRQQDYTRKTQELAEEKRKLHQADALAAMLEADPVGTLKQLSDIYDVDPVQGFAPIERSPEEQAFRTQQRALQAQQQSLAQQRINLEIAQIQAEHGDFDIMATAAYAKDRGLDLPTAYKLMRYEEDRKSADAESRNAANRTQARAAQVVHTQGTAARGSVQPNEKPVQSLREAYERAKQQLSR